MARSQVYGNNGRRVTVADADTGTVHIVRIRETQEYEVEVTTISSSRVAAQLARRKFLDMTVVEQAATSVGISGRSFEAGDKEFDEDELAAEGDG
jgi:hypothetical protein